MSGDLSTLETDGATSTRAKDEVMLVFSGKSGAGKSTLVSNILKVQMDTQAEEVPMPVAGLTPNPVTEISRDYTLPKRNGITLKVVDTVGLISGEDMSRSLQDLATYTKGEADLLVYCLHVGPGLKFVDGNPAMMKALQKAFGKDVWKHCLLVFTFSNLIWEKLLKNAAGNEADAVLSYKQYMRQYAGAFEKQLKLLGVTDVGVFTIFDDPVRKKDHPMIVAIPAGDDKNDEVLPSVRMDEDGKWMGVILNEAIESCKDERKAAFRHYFKGWSWKDVGKVAATCAIIGAGGAVIVAAGPVLLTVGLAVGGMLAK